MLKSLEKSNISDIISIVIEESDLRESNICSLFVYAF
jgi:type II secretory pathway predicted ATPase ExeA